MNKRELTIAAIEGKPVTSTPSCFSLHFPTDVSRGEAAVQSHLDFFDQTGTAILKIMNENLVPDVGDIRTPDDWNKIPTYSLSDGFMVDQIELVKRILDRCDGNAFTLGTIHGICASAIHPIVAHSNPVTVRTMFCTHLRENKTPLIEAYKRITDGMCLLADKYISLGLDGIYYAALGAERRYFTDEEFAAYIEPFDQQILSASKQAGGYNFLHICKDGLNMQRYANYEPFIDVANWGVYETDFSLEEGRKLFPNTVIMGGLANRSGVFVEGTQEEIRQEVQKVIGSFGRTKFIMGADCTLPTEIEYGRIRSAVEAAL